MSITNKDVTGGEVTGSGFFDELMRTSKDHLVQEYDAGRLVGAEYGAAYLGVMQSNLQFAIQFVLQREINNQQALLLQEQVQQGIKQNDLLLLQLAQAEIANETAQYNLDNILPEQFATQKEQTKLVTAQIAETTAKTVLTTAQTAQSTAQSAAQVSLTGKQEDLVDEQIKTESMNTTLPTAGLALQAYNKSLAEVSILNQKKITEEYQTTGSPSGVLGADIALKAEQKNAFIRDAEQKAAKIYADLFSILYSTDSTNLPSDWGLSASDSGEIMDVLKAGVTS